MKVFDLQESQHNVSELETRDILCKLIHNKLQKNPMATDAFYLVDLGEVIRKFQQWTEQLPRIKPFYAVKCNPDKAVCATLKNLGCGFDCASKQEISQMLSLGASPKDIIYANPCKQSSHIQYVKENGVARMTFDNAHELYKIKEIYPKAEILIRILTDDKHSVCQLGTKFGARGNTWKPLLQLAQKLNLSVVGVSFHVGSGCFNADAFRDAVVRAKTVFDIGAELNMKLNILDIGGGFPGTDDAVISFSSIAKVLNSALDEHFPESLDIDIIAEPGRYFVASSHSLAVNVIAKRTVSQTKAGDDDLVQFDYDSGLGSVANGSGNSDNEKPDASFMYYVNDGCYGSFNCLLFDHATVTPLALCKKDGQPFLENLEKRTCSVWGPTCDSIDCLNSDATLPELSQGDWILYRDMGAYTICAASTFNGFDRPCSYYVDSTAILENYLSQKQSSNGSLSRYLNLNHLKWHQKQPVQIGNATANARSGGEGNGSHHNTKNHGFGFPEQALDNVAHLFQRMDLSKTVPVLGN